MESIIYLITCIILFIGIMIYKKNDKKINILKSLVIIIVIFMCYNLVVSYILNLLRIPITITSLSIINFLCSIAFYIKLLKDRSIQKFYINKKDVLALFIILIVTLTMGYLNYGKELNIKYITTDAAVHFKAAREFYDNDKLLNRTEGTSISKQFMTGAYVNTGILFKVFHSIIGENNLYKIFIGFDVGLFFLLGAIMYIAISENIKSKLLYFLSILFCVIFLLGYPLNSMIYGYVYLQLGVVIISTIILFYQCIENIDKKILLIGLFFLNFGLFFTYCIFVPIIYFAEGLYFLLNEIRNKNRIFTISNVITIFVTLCIPSILGIIYFVIPHIFNEKEQIFITIEGYIYRNCWSNFILIIPFALYYIFTKEVKNQVYKISLITLLVYMPILFFIIYSFNLSTYYYYKNNYVLWFMIWYGFLNYINIYINSKKLKKIIIIFSLFYTILMVITIGIKRVPITKEYIDNDENIYNIFDIYGINKTILKDVEIDYTQEELKLLEYINNNINLEGKRILIIGNVRQEFWFDGFFEYKNREDLQTYIPKEDVDKWNNSKEFEYLLIFYRSYAYDMYDEELIYKDKIYENESGAIYINCNESKQNI